mgnify:FL=1
MRVEHRGMVDVIPFFGQGSFHCQRLYINLRLHEGYQMWGQGTNFGGLNAVMIHETGDFNARALREIINQSVIFDVTVNHAGGVGFQTVDDERAVFTAEFEFSSRSV